MTAMLAGETTGVRARVLVAYDTRNGSTTGVAEAVAARLRERGCAVEVLPARAVRDVAGWSALVVGAPIYAGAWLKGAHKVLKRAGKLPPDRRPLVAVFALGPRRDESPEDWIRPRAQFEQALAKHPAVTPVSTALFGGADPPGTSPRRDIRDWDAISDWADELFDAFAGEDEQWT
jgi:menaquinone-dependent protoporphyrinogen oxidase